MYAEILKKTLKYKPLDISKTPKEYNIILNTDCNLFNQMLVLIYSLKANLDKPINLYIFQSDFNSLRVKELKNFAETLDINLTLIDVEIDKFEKFNDKRFPKQVYYYLLVFELLPSSCERALKLDIDTIVLKNLENFYNIDFDDQWLAVCPERDNYLFKQFLENLDNDKFVYSPYYSTEVIFNPGVMLFNIKKFKENNINLDNFINIQKEEDIVTRLPEQMLINRFAKSDIKLLPSLYYNCFNGYEKIFRECFNKSRIGNEVYSVNELDEACSNSIIHFTGYRNLKPWDALCGLDENGNFQFRNVNNGYPEEIQKNNFKKWWDYSLNIPSKNFGELLSRSLLLNTNIKHENEKVFLTNKYILKLFDEFYKNITKYKLKSIVNPDFHYIQYPISIDGKIHYEIYLNNNFLFVSLHFEGDWKSRSDIISNIIESSRIEEKLERYSSKFFEGCYYKIQDLLDFHYSISLLEYLIQISFPILKNNNMISIQKLGI